MNDAKRRDNKGRLLRTGESQRDDGRYMYRYKDPYGKVKTVYSWRLTSTDSTPDCFDCIVSKEVREGV